MKVETFEIESVAEQTEQQTAEALQLCQELGLKGQTTHPPKSKFKSRIGKSQRKKTLSMVNSVLKNATCMTTTINRYPCKS